MTTPWILIMLISVYGGYAPHSVEFNSEKSCKSAIETLSKDKWVTGKFYYFYCVPK
jgi:hypothetical protein